MYMQKKKMNQEINEFTFPSNLDSIAEMYEVVHVVTLFRFNVIINIYVCYNAIGHKGSYLQLTLKENLHALFAAYLFFVVVFFLVVQYICQTVISCNNNFN